MAIRTYVADEPRFVAPRNWLLFEGQRTNSFRNPRCEGAVVGTPGSLPTFWSFASALGLTTGVVGTGNEDGLPYIDLRFFGTPTSSGTLQVNHDVAPTASDGQIWTYSLYSRLVAGSLSNVGAAAMVATAGTGNVVTNYTLQASSLRENRTTCTVTAAGGAANIVGRLRFPVTINLPVDATVRIGAIQLEQGPSASTPILPPVGSPAVSTRGRDSLVQPSSGLLPGLEGSIIFQAMIAADAPAGADQMIFQLDNNADTDRIRVRNLAGGSTIVAGTVIGGASVDAPSVGTIVPGTPFRGIMTLTKAGRLAIMLSGGTVQSLNGLPASLPWLRMGNNLAGTAGLFGEIGRIETRGAVIADGDMQSVLNAL
ncbi:phage head spike fiber domain-containing protein [Falsiroseomonas sp.]|uniref:phage head spike fiber domain-containing protein n=1 Tax=Falsiroseomonas sp. TaxID=2870721 RepID=UPI003F70E341